MFPPKDADRFASSRGELRSNRAIAQCPDRTAASSRSRAVMPMPLTWARDLPTFMHPHPLWECAGIPLSGERAMIDLHYWTTPNGHKITMFLEETGLKYKIFPVQIGKGEQFKPEFLAISPNNRIPAMVDHEPKGGAKPISVFESGAMLLYLAEKTGKFLPTDF